MRRLFECTAELEPAIAAAERVWLGADFDGTLAALARAPEAVRLDCAVRSLLERLVSSAGMSLGIISGRSLRDVRGRIALEGIAYAGNHGLEIDGCGLRRVDDEAVACRPRLARSIERMERLLAQIPGVLIERKGLSASVHVRGVPADRRNEVRRIVAEEAGREEGLIVRPGALVWEVRPACAWDKGKAAAWLLREQAGRDALPIYIGDDATDEDAFRALRRHITIRVGAPRPTRANYVVERQRDVPRFLEWLLRSREQASLSRAGVPDR